MRYLVVANIKKAAKEKERRVGKDFLTYLDAHVGHLIDKACAVHNGGAKTLNKAIAEFVGITAGVETAVTLLKKSITRRRT